MNHETKMSACWHCHTGLDGHMNAGSASDAPVPGGVSMCIYCGAWMIFDEGADGNLGMRKPTDEEWVELINDAHLLRSAATLVAARERLGIGVPE